MKKYMIDVGFSYQHREFEFQSMETAGRFISILLDSKTEDSEEIEITVRKEGEQSE